MGTAERFAEFARVARDSGSPLYADWAAGVAGDDALVALVDRAAASQRQPVLVFAVCRWLGSGEPGFSGLREWILRHSDAFVAELDRRHTQTNDVRRAAPVAAALARIDGPVALIEVGASAGLCLYPDRYALSFEQGGAAGGRVVLGDASSGVQVTTTVVPARGSGRRMLVPPAAVLPAVATRSGLDLAPLDVRSPGDMHWLETLLWPGQSSRVELLRAAVALAAGAPPVMRAGDAVEGLPGIVEGVHPGLTPVVVSTGSLVYLPGARRQAFVDEVARLGVRWISYEKTGSLTGVHATLPPRSEPWPGFATLALDGVALATGDAHGTTLFAL